MTFALEIDSGTAEARAGSVQRLVLPSSPKPYYHEDGIALYHGDARAIAPLLKADALAKLL